MDLILMRICVMHSKLSLPYSCSLFMELHNLFERCVLGLRDSAILCLEISFLHDKTERVGIHASARWI